MDPDKDNFYSIIETAKDLIQDNDWWVIKEEKNDWFDKVRNVGKFWRNIHISAPFELLLISIFF